MKFKDLLKEVLNEEILEEAKVSELLKKDAKLLTKSEINQLAKFLSNLQNRRSENRPSYKTENPKEWEKEYIEHVNKTKEIEQKIKAKLNATGNRGEVTVTKNGYYR